MTPILSLLNTQQEHLTVLLSLLKLELQAISDRDIAKLDENSKQKIACLEQIQKIDQLIGEHGEINAAKQQQWFIEKVVELDACLQDCKEQNEVNRVTLEQSQLVIERYKHELLQNRGKSGLTYTAKGKPALDSIGKGVKA